MTMRTGPMAGSRRWTAVGHLVVRPCAEGE